MIRILSPVPVCIACIGHFALCKSLALHLRIDLGVNSCGVQRDVPEPGADGVDVHAGA